MRKHWVKVLTALITAIGLLSACSQHMPAPVFEINSQSGLSRLKSVSDKSSQKQTHLPASYSVKPGDTLFSIAWLHSLDYKNLAKINKLKNNLIYPGQVLSLHQNYDETYFDPESLLQALNREILKRPASISRIAQLKKNSSSNKPSINKRLNITTESSKKAISKSKVKTGTSRTARKYRRTEPLTETKLNWIWPTEGSILAKFSSKSNANRGLDIAGKRGQPVRASERGRVVYRGNGLRGYGNLVIIKHSENYLSAYAHNDMIYVAENEVVKSGQRIADIGSSGTQREKLHFEIRYKGKPVDPLNYLPQRKR